MTIKEFFTGRTIVITALLVIGLGFLAYDTFFKTHNSGTGVEVVETQPTTETPKPLSTEPPVFEWKFEKAETLNPDGLPATEVYLQASYAGDAVGKLIATEPGGCNVVSDTKEKDIAADSSVALCYAAGAGAYFKVVKGTDSYQVMKQEFEEGMPEYNPPIQSYKVVAEFPFAI